MIQQFTFNGQGRQIDAQGTMLRYELGTEPNGNTDLNVWLDGMNIGRMSVGDMLELPIAAKRWEVKPVSTSCTGTLRIGLGRMSTAKIAGTVTAIDNDLTASNSGQSRMAYTTAASSAGNYPTVQLFCDPGSVRCALQRVEILAEGASVDAAYLVYGHSYQAGTPSSQSFGVNKHNSLTGATFGRAMGLNIPPNDPGFSVTTLGITKTIGGKFVYEPKDPIVMGGNRGFYFSLWLAGAVLRANFEWREIPAG
jgi:hypothetical protein